jgi:hypothetical protein
MLYDLAIRETHAYVAAYSHLDEWQSIGGYHHVYTETLEETEDGSHTYAHYVAVELDRDFQPNPLDFADEAYSAYAGRVGYLTRRALMDAFTASGCTHEHDCCGCASYYAEEVDHIAGNIWRIEQSACLNY